MDSVWPGSINRLKKVLRMKRVCWNYCIEIEAAAKQFLEEWGKLLGDVPTAGAILDRFLRHAQTIAITGRSYRLKDHATIAGKEDKNKKIKSKLNEPSTAGAAS
jgi:hypothetical protein